MNKKLLFILPLFALLITSISAMSIFGCKTDGGIVNYIGQDNSFEKSSIQSSYWFSEGRTPIMRFGKLSNGIDPQGKGTLEVITYVPKVDGTKDRVVLNLNLEFKSVMWDYYFMTSTLNTATGTYFKEGVGIQKINFDSVRYEYQRWSNNVNIIGESQEGINFAVTNLQIVK